MNMMKRFFYLAAIFVTVLCTATAQQTYDIRLNLNPPVKVPLRQNMRQDNSVSYGGQTMKSVNNVKTDLVFSIMEKKGDNYIINAVINKIEVENEGMGQTQKISSEDSENSFNKTIKKMTHNVVKAEITPYFEVVGEPVAVTEGVDNEVAKAIMKSFTDLLSELYHASVKKGDSWTVEDKEAGSKNVYTLTDVTEHSYLINAKLSIDGDFQGAAVSGVGSMNVEIDRATGVPLYGLMTLPLKGSAMAEGMMINIETNTTSSFELAQ